MSMPSKEAARCTPVHPPNPAIRVARTIVRDVTCSLAMGVLLAACAQGRLPAPVDAGESASANSRAAATPDFTHLAKVQGPAVVDVLASQSVGHEGPTEEQSEALDEFFRHYPPDAPDELRAQVLASGFIIGADGYVLTNAHAVAGADDVSVRLADGKRDLEARVLGLDMRTDIALLKVDGHDLPTVVLGNSASLKVGEWVAAIGSPFGFDNTITAGIVSAKDRTLADEVFVSFIQTDVPLNPGSSGGPLLNTRGEVVGINSKIYSRSGGHMGVSFAIPIEVAMDIGKQLREHGKVTRGQLGIRTQDMTDQLAQSFSLDSPRGALIVAVQMLSPAERAGLQLGDVVLRYQGKSIEKANSLPRMVAQTSPGTRVSLDVWRDGNEQRLDAIVGELEGNSPVAKLRPITHGDAPFPSNTNRLGLQVAELQPGQVLGPRGDRGLLVQVVRGAAARTSIRAGDVILAVNGTSLRSVEELDQRVAQVPAGRVVALLVLRGMKALYVPVQVEETG